MLVHIFLFVVLFCEFFEFAVKHLGLLHVNEVSAVGQLGIVEDRVELLHLSLVVGVETAVLCADDHRFDIQRILVPPSALYQIAHGARCYILRCFGHRAQGIVVNLFRRILAGKRCHEALDNLSAVCPVEGMSKLVYSLYIFICLRSVVEAVNAVYINKSAVSAAFQKDLSANGRAKTVALRV